MLYPQAGIGSICQCSTTTVNSDRNTTDQITHPHSQTSPEQSISRVHIRSRIYIVGIHKSKLRRKDDRHDDAVNGDHFTENDGDQILRSNARSFDSTSNNGGTCDKDTPSQDLSWTSDELGRGVCTMLLQQLTILCTIQYPYLPMRMVIHLRGIVRTAPIVNLHRLPICQHWTYVESFSIACEEHIY